MIETMSFGFVHHDLIFHLWNQLQCFLLFMKMKSWTFYCERWYSFYSFLNRSKDKMNLKTFSINSFSMMIFETFNFMWASKNEKWSYKKDYKVYKTYQSKISSFLSLVLFQSTFDVHLLFFVWYILNFQKWNKQKPINNFVFSTSCCSKFFKIEVGIIGFVTLKE